MCGDGRCSCVPRDILVHGQHGFCCPPHWFCALFANVSPSKTHQLEETRNISLTDRHAQPHRGQRRGLRHFRPFKDDLGHRADLAPGPTLTPRSVPRTARTRTNTASTCSGTRGFRPFGRSHLLRKPLKRRRGNAGYATTHLHNATLLSATTNADGRGPTPTHVPDLGCTIAHG